MNKEKVVQFLEQSGGDTWADEMQWRFHEEHGIINKDKWDHELFSYQPIIITIDEFLVKMESSLSVSVYEYYDGLQILIDSENFGYLLETKDYLLEQLQIFKKLETLENLVRFEYTSRFPTEINYETLLVPKNLKNLTISHMKKISDVTQLGNIEYLCLECNSYEIKFLNLLPKTLKKIDIMILEVGNQEEYNEIIEYFNTNNIRYYIDDYSDYAPENEQVKV